MKHTRKMALLGGLMTIVGLLLLFPTRTFAALSSSPTFVQCSSSSIPPGWIILNHSTDWSKCGGAPWIIGNMEMIERPGLQQGKPGTVVINANVICADSPVPPGYVTTAQFPLENSSCERGTIFSKSGAMIAIDLVSPNDNYERVCASSPIPADFVISSTRPLPMGLESCSIDQQSGLTLKPASEDIVRVTGMPMTVCSNSPVPASYFIEQADNDSNCGPGLNNARDIAPNSYSQG